MMSHNLTNKQREALKFLVEQQQVGNIEETFLFLIGDDQVKIRGINDTLSGGISIYILEALAQVHMIYLERSELGGSATFTQAAYDAVAADFNSDETEPNILRLHTFLTKQFGPEQLRTLATLLDIESEMSQMSAPSSYARDLIENMKRRGRLWELVHIAFIMG